MTSRLLSDFSASAVAVIADHMHALVQTHGERLLRCKGLLMSRG
jgi:hypothetical protein